MAKTDMTRELAKEIPERHPSLFVGSAIRKITQIKQSVKSQTKTCKLLECNRKTNSVAFAILTASSQCLDPKTLTQEENVQFAMQNVAEFAQLITVLLMHMVSGITEKIASIIRKSHSLTSLLVTSNAGIGITSQLDQFAMKAVESP